MGDSMGKQNERSAILSDDVGNIVHSGNVTILAIFENQPLVPITDGLLMMAAYLQFVVPKETRLVCLSQANLDTSIFEIVSWNRDKVDENLGKVAIFRHLRNAIAHARVELDGEYFHLKDWDPRHENSSKTNPRFHVKVQKSAFGNMLKDVMLFWMRNRLDEG